MKPAVILFVVSVSIGDLIVAAVGLLIFGMLLICGLWKQARNEQRKERD